jgi:RHS repeat-associated protein
MTHLRFDNETGWYYYRTRYMDPFTGRFTTRDTIGIWGDPFNVGNGYTYVNNNPWTKLDPFGLTSYDVGPNPPALRPPDVGSGKHGRYEPGLGDYATELKWDLGAGWAGIVKGWDDASEHMHHYLGNSGDEYTIDAEGLFTEDPRSATNLYNDLNNAIEFVESADSPSARFPFHIISQQCDQGKTDKGGNWFYAVNGYQYWGSGLVDKVGNGSYSMEFTIHFDDTYNWDIGKGTDLAQDTELGRLHVVGLAQEYHMTGSYTITVDWNSGQRFDSDTGELCASSGSSSSSSSSSGGSSGRGRGRWVR